MEAATSALPLSLVQHERARKCLFSRRRGECWNLAARELSEGAPMLGGWSSPGNLRWQRARCHRSNQALRRHEDPGATSCRWPTRRLGCCKQHAEMGEAGRQGGGGAGWSVFWDPWIRIRIDTGSMQRHHGLSVGGGLPYQTLLLTCWLEAGFVLGGGSLAGWIGLLCVSLRLSLMLVLA